MSVSMYFTPPSMNVALDQYEKLAQWLSNSLITFALVKAASSKGTLASGPYAGAADYAGATPPGAINTDGDWEIWRLADALHATCPIYFKFTWRTGASTSHVSMKLKVGTGFNGTNDVTGNLFAEVTLAMNGISASPCWCVISGDTNRVALALWAGPDAVSNAAYVIWGIERLHNADGTDNDEGVWVYGEAGAASATHNNQVITRPALGGNGQLESKLGHALMVKGNSTLMYGGDIGLGPIFPMRGKALYPARNFMVTDKSSLAGGGGAVVTLDHYYGVPQKWWNVARGQTLWTDASLTFGWGLMMRFE